MAQAEPGMTAEDRAGLERRGEEVREIARRVVRNLTRAPFRSFSGLPDGAMLVANPCGPPTLRCSIRPGWRAWRPTRAARRGIPR